MERCDRAPSTSPPGATGAAFLLLGRPLFLTRARRWRSSPRRIDREHTKMMLKIACPCGHVGIVDASTLPRSLVCSSCGASRHVEADQGRAIVSTDRFEEYLAGERERPQVRRKAASLASS
jgi:hypothetical protein